MSQPEPLKCTGSLIPQLKDAHLYHRKTYKTNTGVCWGKKTKQKKKRAMASWLTRDWKGMVVFLYCKAARQSVSTARIMPVQMFVVVFLLSRSCIPTMWQQWNMGAGFHQQNMGQLQRMREIPLPLQPQPWRGEAPLECSISTCFLTICIPPEYLIDRASAFVPLP